MATGAVLAFAAANALHRGKAHVRAPMVMLAVHLDHLRGLASPGDCTAADALARLAQVAAAARETRYAYRAWIDADAGFAARQEDFEALADASAQAPVVDCDDLAERVERLGLACQDCHRRYR